MSQKKEWHTTPGLHMMYRTDLAKAMALHIVKSGPTWDDIKPYFHKRLLDSPELKRRYKGHAYQLRQVKRRTAKVFDERRQCFLYEDGEIVGEKLIGNGSQRLKPYKWYRRGPKYHRKLFDWLKAKLDKALAAACAAIAEDEDEVVPPVVRQLLIRKINALESMKTEIDLVANGNIRLWILRGLKGRPPSS